MAEPLTVRGFFAALQETLELQWRAGRAGGGRLFHGALSETAVGGGASLPLTGYLNVIRPSQLQVCGTLERAYLVQLSSVEQDAFLSHLLAAQPAALLAVDGVEFPSAFIERAEANAVPLICSSRAGLEVMELATAFLQRRATRSTVLHGVLLELNGVGVLLAGHAGVGKSELALELLNRGSRLVADDAPEFVRVPPDRILGRCPPVLQDFLEVRGLGILDVRAMYGDNAVKHEAELKLVVQLQRLHDGELPLVDRFQDRQQHVDVLGVAIPALTLPIMAGSNMAVLVESAVRNHLLRVSGYNATDRFIGRQQHMLSENDL